MRDGNPGLRTRVSARPPRVAFAPRTRREQIRSHVVQVPQRARDVRQRAQPRRERERFVRVFGLGRAPQRVVQAAAVQQRHENRADARKRFVFSHFSFFLLRDGAGVGARRERRDQTRRLSAADKTKHAQLVFERCAAFPVDVPVRGLEQFDGDLLKNRNGLDIRLRSRRPAGTTRPRPRAHRRGRAFAQDRAERDVRFELRRGERLECPRMFRDIDVSIDARDVFVTRVGFGNRRAFAFVGFGDSSRFGLERRERPDARRGGFQRER